VQSIAYIRVSTEEQVYGTSLESQQDACVAFAEQNGYELPKANIFREEGESAKILDRTQLQKLLSFVKENQGKIEYCIVWKVDRLARKSEYHHAIKGILMKYGVKLRSVTEPIDDSPTGSLMEGVLAAFAQFDNDIRTMRTTSGMRARTMQGGWPHQATFGYSKCKTPAGITSLKPDKDAPLAQKLLTLFATGSLTTSGAVRYAQEIGIKSKTTGKPYRWQSISDMLQNPAYAGFICSKYTEREYIKGLHKPIISPETHYKIKAILNGRYKMNSRHADESWPLKGGFLRCFHCSTSLTGSSTKGRTRHYPRYSCPKCRVSESIPATSRGRDDVHKEFIELLKNTQPKEDIANGFKEIMIRRWNLEYKDAIEQEKRLAKELTAIQEKKSRVIDLYIEGKLSDSQKTDKLKQLDGLAAEYELQKVETKDGTVSIEKTLDTAILFMSSVEQLWSMGSIEVKKQIQDLIFPEGLTYHFKDGLGSVVLSRSHLLISKIADKSAKNSSMVAVTGIEPVTSGL
jgi:site-specific DNA recombinase